MIVKLIRVEASDQGALGVLLINGSAFCCTLEPDANDPVKGHIKPGVYDCFRFSGTKWKDTFEIAVPGHTAVLFHSGNIEADSMMCVLLGASFGNLRGHRAVLNSGETFKNFLDRTKGLDKFTLFVEDHLT